jgi:hypothetical protein
MARLGRLWQMLSIDLPWAVSNWLWANIVNHALASLRQLTPRRLIYLAAFLIVAWAAAEIMTVDLAVMFAGDVALYCEIASFFYLAIARNRVHRAIRPVTQMTRVGVQRAMIRVTARTRRPLRRPRLFDSAGSDDVPDGAFA